jgi:hypothetical protein
LEKSRGSGLRIGVALCRPCAPILPAHHSIYHLLKECRHPFREPLQFTVMSVMSGTFPDTYGVFYMTVNRWCVWGPSRHRHGERHRRNALPKWLPRRRDGDNAHDDELLMFSWGASSGRGASLLCRLSYPFKMTRRTRRAEQAAPYLCGFPTYDWRRVCLISLITGRRYPTRGMVHRRVCSEHRRVTN